MLHKKYYFPESMTKYLTHNSAGLFKFHFYFGLRLRWSFPHSMCDFKESRRGKKIFFKKFAHHCSSAGELIRIKRTKQCSQAEGHHQSNLGSAEPQAGPLHAASHRFSNSS